jgi:ferric-dicitrate binding protein FerR (iron transport regulator)
MKINLKTCAIAFLVLVMSSNLISAMAVQQAPVGTLRSSGKVRVDGKDATPNLTVDSGSTVQTAKGSSAVVSLGKLGRVEVQPGSSVKLSLDGSSIGIETAKGSAVVSLGKLGRVEVHEGSTLKLTAVRVRVSSSSGMTATVSTKDGDLVAVGSNEFVVDVTCGNTAVQVKSGTVELRAGSGTKQIAAGNQDTAGTAREGCKLL